MKENKFDKLTVKCIEEIPILVEVLSSTGKIIEDTFSFYYDDLHKLIEENLPKRYWEINEKERDNVLYQPFISEPIKEIKSLRNYFLIISEIRVERKVNEIIKGGFYVEMGFCYNALPIDGAPETRFYFCLARNNDMQKSSPLNDLPFYEKIKKDNPKYKNNIIICHPDLDHEEEDESIEIYCEEIDTNKIDDIYKVFREKIIIRFIENLK